MFGFLLLSVIFFLLGGLLKCSELTWEKWLGSAFFSMAGLAIIGMLIFIFLDRKDKKTT